MSEKKRRKVGECPFACRCPMQGPACRGERRGARGCCKDCIYSLPVRDGRRTRLMCANRPERPGQATLVERTDRCENFRVKRNRVVRLPAPPPPDEHSRYIPLTQGKFAVVSVEDYERLSQYNWCISRSGRRLYACRNENGRHIAMHRFLMNPPKGMVVDHIDGDGLNNRRSNLRVCTQQQNLWNTRPTGKSSKYKGVSRDKQKKKWVVYVRCNDENLYCGRFDDEVEAARVYDREAFARFGAFAYLNFPKAVGQNVGTRAP